jgi:hypothetical protein
LVRSIGRNPFPQDRIADCRQAQPRDLIDVAGAIVMSGFADLVAPLFADAIDGAFDAAPKFHRPLSSRCRRDDSRRHVNATSFDSLPGILLIYIGFQ